MKVRLRHDRLRLEISKRPKLSQNAWALRLGLERGHFSKLLHGKRPYPSPKTRRRLLKGLGVPFETLFECRDDRPASTPRRHPLTGTPRRRKEVLMQTLLLDIRFGLRGLAHRPAWTFFAAAVLALGMGANAGIFHFAETLFLRPPDLPHPERVMRLFGADFDVMSYPNYQDLSRETQAFSQVAAHQQTIANLGSGQTGAQPVQGELVTGNYFETMGIRAAAGRLLRPEDDVVPGGHPVVIVSYSLWKNRLGEDPSALGRELYLNGHPFRVVGVAPASFRGSYEAYPSEFWAPMAMYEQVRPRGVSIQRRGWGWLIATGRLKEGVSMEQAGLDLNRVTRVVREIDPRVNAGLAFQMIPAGRFPEGLAEKASGFVGFFAAAGGLVLLVVCGNLASLLLARSAARRREMAVRLSLGAGRSRLLRLWLTESLLLTLLGALGSLPVALLVTRAFGGLHPPGQQVFAPDPRFNLQLLGFTLLLGLMMTFLFAMVPGWRAGKADVSEALRDESATSTAGPRRTRLLGSFVAGQVAVSAMLLVTCGLLLRSLLLSADFNPGFDSGKLLLADLDLRLNGYPPAEARSFFDQLERRLSARSDVEAVAYAMSVPLGSGRDTVGLVIPGQDPPPGRDTFPIEFNVVSTNYFRTMGIPLLEGRGFSDTVSNAAATSESRPLEQVVVNTTLAQRFWPGDSAVGKRMRNGSNGPWMEIAGVVRDIRYHQLGEVPRPYVYASFGPKDFRSAILHVRGKAAPDSLKADVALELKGLDPQVAPLRTMSMAEWRRLPLFPQRAMAWVSAAFGLLTVVLTAVGLFGLLTYTVRRRTHEIGLRMALGADPGLVWKRVALQGLRVAAIGAVIGLAGGWFAARFLAGMLFGVGAADPLTYALVCLFLLLVALVASAVPARLAARVDPIRALRRA